MITRAVSGSVIEAYAPGMAMPKKRSLSPEEANPWDVRGYQYPVVSPPFHPFNTKMLAR
ncbi:hypothetical protein [Lusitaniella coriacea]|uniref:hypothetical protein n=1 Tax=Lusitaniella coriacea TaxID=1983105 RepID=UPI003CE896DD